MGMFFPDRIISDKQISGLTIKKIKVKSMKLVSISLVVVLSVFFFSCKKSKTAAPDVKDRFVGSWAGTWQYASIGQPYPYSLQLTSSNTLTLIDSAFGNQPFSGTYRYTADSLLITLENGTKWNMKFINNYTNCAGAMIGSRGALGTVNMTKK